MSDVRHVVLSHFHPDHVGGLREFPDASCIAHEDAWRPVREGGRFNHLLAQIWRELLPENLASRLRTLDRTAAIPLDGAMALFGRGWDLFGDGSLIAFELPGHAAGQVALPWMSMAHACSWWQMRSGGANNSISCVRRTGGFDCLRSTTLAASGRPSNNCARFAIQTPTHGSFQRTARRHSKTGSAPIPMACSARPYRPEDTRRVGLVRYHDFAGG